MGPSRAKIRDQLMILGEARRTRVLRFKPQRACQHETISPGFLVSIRKRVSRGVSRRLRQITGEVYGQLPVCDDHEKPAAVTPKGLTCGKMTGFVPRSQLFGSQAAALHSKTVSRVIATIAVKGLKLPRLGYFDDFGMAGTESAIRGAQGALAASNAIIGCDLKIEKSERGAMSAFFRATARFVVFDKVRQAHLSLSPDRPRKLTDGIALLLERRGVFLAQMRNLVVKVDFAQIAVMGRVGRVALRQLYGLAMIAWGSAG